MKDKYDEAIKNLSDENIEIYDNLAMYEVVNGEPHPIAEEAQKHIEINGIAIQALQQAKERENPQPLTLEQLKERVGKPVYECSAERWRVIEIVVQDEGNQYTVFMTDCAYYPSDDIEKGNYKFYDHEPKGIEE